MENTVIKAGMSHSLETLERFLVLQSTTFNLPARVITLVCSIAMIAYGGLCFASSASAKLLLFLGCIVLTNINARQKYNAKQIYNAFKGSFPVSEYSFFPKYFTDSDKSAELKYSGLIKLVEDREYLYLFVDTKNGYMVDKTSIEGSADALKERISAGSGKSWEKPVSVFNFRLQNLLKKKKTYQGERLKEHHD